MWSYETEISAELQKEPSYRIMMMTNRTRMAMKMGT